MGRIRLRNFLFLLISLMISYNVAQAQQPVKDVFVLIDVSATMRDDAINKEAKQHVKNILLGKFSLSDANRQGWSMQHKCDILENSKPIIKKGSFLAIIPFGNKDRYDERTFNRFSDVDSEFDAFFEKNYRLDHKDQLTFLDLARGYAGSLAKAQAIKKSYMIIYSDNLNNETGSMPYTDYENKIVDSWNVEGINKYKTLGILSRKVGKYTYKIYIGQLEIYDVEVRDEDKAVESSDNDPSPTPKITITNPKNSSLREPAKVKTKEEVTVSWMGATNANVSITKNNGKSYVRLSPKDRAEAEVKVKGGNSAKIIFYDSGNYKVTVSKGSVSTSAYYDVSSPFPFGLILGLIIAVILLVAGIRVLPGLFNSSKGGNKSNSPSTFAKNTKWE